MSKGSRQRDRQIEWAEWARNWDNTFISDPIPEAEWQVVAIDNDGPRRVALLVNAAGNVHQTVTVPHYFCVKLWQKFSSHDIQRMTRRLPK